MPMSPQAVAFGIQAIIRLGQSGKRAYEAKILDASITLPSVDVASLDAPAVKYEHDGSSAAIGPIVP